MNDPCRQWKKTAVRIAVAAAVIGLIVVMANVLFVGNLLRNIHPALAIAFYAICAASLWWTLLGPVFRAVRSPKVSVRQLASDDTCDASELRRAAIHLASQGAFSPEQRDRLRLAASTGTSVSEAFRDIYSGIEAKMDRLVVQHAVLIGATTALSQNGRLDFLAVLSGTWRMLSSMQEATGLRPAFGKLLSLYLTGIGTALTAQAVEDFDIGDLLASLVDKSPISMIAASLADGLINAFVVLRVGYVFKKLLVDGDQAPDRRELFRGGRKFAWDQRTAVVTALKATIDGASGLVKS